MGFFDVMKELVSGVKHAAGHDKAAQELEANFPARPGKENYLSVGAMLILEQPAKTLKMHSSVEGMKNYVLKTSWGITDATTAQAVLKNLRELKASSTVDLSRYFTQDMMDAYENYGRTGKVDQALTNATLALSNCLPDNAMGIAVGALVGKKIGLSYTDVLSQTHVKSWDIERLAGVARQCYYVDYITEDECYEYLEIAYNLAKEHYTSWKEYVAGYFIGRAVLYGVENFDQWEDKAKELLTQENSIWSVCPL